MTFKEIWGQLVAKKPELVNPATRLEFTSANLERLLKQVYEQGQARGIEHTNNIFGSFLKALDK